MSSAATITLDSDTRGVAVKEWRSFCKKHCIRHSPQTVGGNVYYDEDWIKGVEITYDRHELRFSTYQGGRAMPNVARLAMIAWQRWGGTLRADPEIQQLIAQGAAA